MNKYYQSILALVLIGLSSHVVAETLGYTSASVGYSRFSSEIEGFSEVPEGGGVSFDLSVAIRPYAVIIAGYSMGSADMTTSVRTIDADIKSVSLGILVHLPINETADFIIAMSFINGNAEVAVNGAFFANVDADGGATTIGFRAMASDRLEINSFINKISIEDESRFSMRFGAAYYIVESVSVDLGYLFDGDADSLTLGATKYF